MMLEIEAEERWEAQKTRLGRRPGPIIYKFLHLWTIYKCVPKYRIHTYIFNIKCNFFMMVIIYLSSNYQTQNIHFKFLMSKLMHFSSRPDFGDCFVLVVKIWSLKVYSCLEGWVGICRSGFMGCFLQSERGMPLSRYSAKIRVV